MDDDEKCDDQKKHVRSSSSSDVRRLQKDKKSRSEQDVAIKAKISALKKQLSSLKMQNNVLKQKNTKLNAETKKYNDLKQRYKNVKKKNIGIVKGLKDEISALKKNQEGNKQSVIGRSKSESATDYVGKIKFLEDKIKASDIRNGVIYKQYKSANEENLKLRELQDEYKILQKKYAECVEKNQDYEIENQEQTKKIVDEHQTTVEKLKNENICAQEAIKSLETKLENTKQRCLDYELSTKLQTESLNTMKADRAKWSQQVSVYKTRCDELACLLQSEKDKNSKISLESKRLEQTTKEFDEMKAKNDEYQSEIHVLKEKNKKLENDLARSLTKNKKSMNEMALIRTKSRESENECAEYIVKLNEVQAKYDKLALELEEKDKLNENLTKELKSQNAKISKMSEIMKQFSNDMNKNETKVIEKLKNESQRIEEYEKKLHKLAIKLEKNKHVNDATMQLNEELSAQNAKLEQIFKEYDAENIEEQLMTLQAKYNKMAEKNDIYLSEMNVLKAENGKLKEQLTQSAESLEKSKESMDLIRTKSRESENECAEYETKLNKMQAKYDKLALALVAKEKLNEDLSKEIKCQNARISKMSEIIKKLSTDMNENEHKVIEKLENESRRISESEKKLQILKNAIAEMNNERTKLKKDEELNKILKKKTVILSTQNAKLKRSKSESAAGYVERIKSLKDEVKSSNSRSRIFYQEYHKMNGEIQTLTKKLADSVSKNDELSGLYESEKAKNGKLALELKEEEQLNESLNTKISKIWEKMKEYSVEMAKNGNKAIDMLKSEDQRVSNSKKKLNKLKIAIAEMRTKLEKDNKKLSTQNAKLRERIKEYDGTKTKNDEYQREIRMLREENKKLVEQFARSSESLDKSEESIQLIRTKSRESENECAEYAAILYEVQTKCDKLALELKEKQRLNEDLNNEITSRNAKISKMSETMKHFSNDMSENWIKVTVKMKNESQRISESQKKLKKLTKKLAEDKHAIDATMQSNKMLKEEIEKLSAQNATLEDKIKASDFRNGAICQQYESANEQLTTLQTKYNEIKAKNDVYLGEMNMLKAENKKLAVQLARSLEKNEESMDLIRTKSRESENECAEYTAKLNESLTKYDKLRIELDAKKLRIVECNMKYAQLSGKYDEVSSKYEDNLEIISELKASIKTMTAQNSKYQQKIKQMIKEKEAEKKKKEINNLKYKIIECNSNLALMKEELIKITQRVNMRMSVPQTSDADADLVDMLLTRQKQMIQEYKKENEIIQRLNQELQTKMIEK